MKSGYREFFAALLLEDLGELHGTVAVGIGLDDSDELCISDLLLDAVDIVFQIGEIDLSPYRS